MTEFVIMTSMFNEQLSALLDGELPVEQEALLLRRLEEKTELRDSLARYSLIGELMRDEHCDLAGLSVSDRVAAAIGRDSYVEQTGRSVPRWNTGLVGAGIAASIALLVMFNLNSLTGSADQAGSSVIPVAQAAQVSHEHANSARMMRYLVSHSRFSNSASRQLLDSHVAMSSHHSPGNW